MNSDMSDSLQSHGLYSPWNSPSQNTGVGSLSLLQRIFPAQGSNPGLPHCRWFLYQMGHKGSPKILSHSVMSDSLQSHGLYSPWNSPGQNTGVGRLFLLLGIFPIQGSNPRLPHCRWILYLQAVVIGIKMVQWMVKGQLHEKVKLLEKVNTLW